jgi:dihydrofolate synthase/folylpolyglutamate synthase
VTYINAVKYIKSAPDIKNSGALLRMLSRLGAPQKRIKYLRLAGSNGKTVCAEMLTSVLTSAGYTVGCLRMPLRDDPRENICIGGKPLSMDEFANYTSLVRDAARECDEENITLMPVGAEILLCIALLAFCEKKCDVCLIESDHFGIDPSVQLPHPFAAVICGTIPSNNDTEINKIRSYICRGIEEIVSVPQNNAAYRIISDTCYKANCRLTLPNKNAITVKRLTLRETSFSYKKHDYTLRLCGRFQVYNAVLVLEVVEMLIRKGFKINADAIAKGFAKLTIPAKFEVISVNPLMLIDSTHSPVAIGIVCDALSDFRDITPKRIRLCLPDRLLIDAYVSELTQRGYEIERVIAPLGEYTTSDTYETVVCKTKKALVKQMLSELDKNTFLLVSGDYPFVSALRYELLASMGF